MCDVIAPLSVIEYYFIFLTKHFNLNCIITFTIVSKLPYNCRVPCNARQRRACPAFCHFNALQKLGIAQALQKCHPNFLNTQKCSSFLSKFSKCGMPFYKQNCRLFHDGRLKIWKSEGSARTGPGMTGMGLGSRSSIVPFSNIIL